LLNGTELAIATSPVVYIFVLISDSFPQAGGLKAINNTAGILIGQIDTVNGTTRAHANGLIQHINRIMSW